MADKKTGRSRAKKISQPRPAARKSAGLRKTVSGPVAEAQSARGAGEKMTLPAFGLAEDILGPAGASAGAQHAEPARHGGAGAAQDMHLVTFKIDREEYGVDISEVREIIRVGQITSVPNAPRHVSGVINIRGRVVPVMSLAKRLDVAEGPLTKHSRIIVVDADARSLGLLVDSVSHVLRIPEPAVEPPPGEAEQSRAYVKGIGKIDTRLIMIMDLRKVLARETREPQA